MDNIKPFPVCSLDVVWLGLNTNTDYKYFPKILFVCKTGLSCLSAHWQLIGWLEGQENLELLPS
jgi:hypothetical protein